MKWAEIAHHDIDEKGKRSKGESGLGRATAIGRCRAQPASSSFYIP